MKRKFSYFFNLFFRGKFFYYEDYVHKLITSTNKHVKNLYDVKRYTRNRGQGSSMEGANKAEN